MLLPVSYLCCCYGSLIHTIIHTHQVYLLLCSLLQNVIVRMPYSVFIFVCNVFLLDEEGK